jgi:hypothetical protein
MDVEVWYHQWRTFPPGISIPTQWSVRRAGSPYKRMTVESADFAPDIEDGLFDVSDELRAAYEAEANRPMHDVPVDSGRVVQDRLVELWGFGNARGAVRMGDGWWLLEAGQGPLNFDRGRAWVEAETGQPVTGVLATLTRTGNGGVAGAAVADVPMVAGRGAEPFVRTMLANRGLGGTPFQIVPAQGMWLVAGADSLWVETMDLPNSRGATLAWYPALGWLYAPAVQTPLDLRLVMLRARKRGWPVELLGTSSALMRPVEGDGG